MNNISLTGRISKDVEMKMTANGKKVIKNSIAVKRRFKTSDGKDADFFNITIWNGQAEYIDKWAKKGDMIAIIGRLENYEDKENKRTYVSITVEEIEIVATTKRTLDSLEEVKDDNIPF